MSHQSKLSIGDTVDYTKLQLAEQGFETMHFTESGNYQLNQSVIEHNLGYTPIAIVYGFEEIGTGSSITADNFVGSPLPITELGFGNPAFYGYIDFYTNKSELVINRQSAHTNNSLEYWVYLKWFLFKQPAQA